MHNSDKEFQQYKRLRAETKELNGDLVHLLSRDAILRGAKDLGLLKGRQLVLGAEEDLSVLMDYCIHHDKAGPRSVLERYIRQEHPDPDSAEMRLLQAYRNAAFSVFVVQGCERGYLCHVHDLIHGRELSLIDSGLGQSATPGVMVAAWLIQMPGRDRFITTGAPIPVTSDRARTELLRMVDKFRLNARGALLSRGQEASLAKQATRMLLRTEGFENAGHLDVTDPRP